jgi:two-component system KDP operon response regulator KdpE
MADRTNPQPAIPRLLLVDDDPALLNVMRQYLERFEYEIATAADGEGALLLVTESTPDLIVLDISMPHMDGLQTLARLRETTQVPVIMLTARAAEPDVLRGFTLGADDYITKPFSFAQLEARIRAVLARTARRAGTPAPPPPEVLEFGDLSVDQASHRVTVRGEPVKLTATEFRLLVALMERRGRVVTPEELVVAVWGPAYASQADYVRRYVWYLRQKLEQDPSNPRYICNERNVGYYFGG